MCFGLVAMTTHFCTLFKQLVLHVCILMLVVNATQEVNLKLQFRHQPVAFIVVDWKYGDNSMNYYYHNHNYYDCDPL